MAQGGFVEFKYVGISKEIHIEDILCLLQLEWFVQEPQDYLEFVVLM